jgi:signal peptidase I
MRKLIKVILELMPVFLTLLAVVTFIAQMVR